MNDWGASGRRGFAASFRLPVDEEIYISGDIEPILALLVFIFWEVGLQ